MVSALGLFDSWKLVRTLKATLLLSVPLGVVTATVPVVAPPGTVVVISEPDTTVNIAAVPLNFTPIVPVRLVPKMVTGCPTRPDVGFVSTNGLSPTERLKTVPKPLGELQERSPPYTVVP